MIDKEKQYKRQNEWRRKNLDRIALEVPKGMKDRLKEQAKAEGKSLNEYLNERISRN